MDIEVTGYQQWLRRKNNGPPDSQQTPHKTHRNIFCKYKVLERLQWWRTKTSPNHTNTTSVLNALLSYTTDLLNCLTIYALTKLSSLPRPFKTLLLSLAVSDLGVGLMVQPSNIATLARKWTNKLKLLDRLLAIYLRLRYQELVNHKRVVSLLILKSVGLKCRLVVYETVDSDTNFVYNLRH